MILDAVLGPCSLEKRAQRVGGTTVFERQLFTLARAGLRRVRVEGERPAEGSFRKPEGLELVGAAEGPRLVLSGRRFYRIEAVRRAALAGGDIEGGIDLDSSSQGETLDWLLEGVRKDSDGFMAKHFDRHISLAVTRRLLDTPVRPNHMTIVSTAIGLIGGVLFFFAVRRLELLGALLIWLHTVLDGCDGEMARLSFRESAWGAWMDFWGDNIVHVALFGGLAAGQLHRERWAVPLGVLACIGTLGSAIGSAWLSAKNRVSGVRGMANLRAEDGLGNRLKELEVTLAQRDFIYVLVVCAFADRLEEFLWAAACGAPLYLFILIYLVRHQNGKVPEPRSRTESAGMAKEPA